MTRTARSRRFVPSVDHLSQRLTPSGGSVTPLDATLVSYTPPAQTSSPSVTPCDATLIVCGTPEQG